MFLSRLAVVCTVVLGLSAAGTGVGFLCHASAVAAPAADDKPVPAVRPADKPAAGKMEKEDPKQAQADRARSMNNLKNLGLAMHTHLDTYGQFPPAAVYSKDGKPLLSWRVLLLPMLGERALFKQFKLDEPWDSAHNKKLLEKMPEVYAPPVRGKAGQPGMTYYQVFTGPGTIFDGQQGLRIADIFDGTSNTLLVVEGAEPVPWTKPADLVYAKNKPVPKVGGLFTQGFCAGMADGSAVFLKKQWDAKAENAMRALIGRNDGIVVDFQVLRPER